jgi:rubrerythrin
MTIKAVLETAVELEKKSMALYALFVRRFRRPADLRRFWFNMARHEAAHCGALSLVEALIDTEPGLVGSRTVSFDPLIVVRLRSLLAAYVREAKQNVGLDRAFEMALDIESSEFEDVVVDLLRVVRDPWWHDQAIQLLIHDLSDMSYMIEKFTRDEALLRRADELVERRLGRAGRKMAGRPAGRGVRRTRVARRRSSAATRA